MGGSLSPEERLRGTGASAGIAIGRAYIADRRALRVMHRHVEAEEVAAEVTRLRDAIEVADGELERAKQKLEERQGEDHFRIFEAQQLILHDEHLVDETVRRITADRINAEWALEKTAEHIRKVFAAIEDDYLRARGEDVTWVIQRIMRSLTGEVEVDLSPPPDAIVIAHGLSPADVASLRRAAISAIVTEEGGETSHTAILARAFDIPTVVGVEGVMSKVGTGDLVIVDGDGEVIIHPGAEVVKEYRGRARRLAALEQELLKDRDLAGETEDGVRMGLMANIELADEIESAISHGAEGIGLYRTEFLFMNRPDLPTEEEHYHVACSVLDMLKGRSATFRTFDLGSDKVASFRNDHLKEQNPALGMRSIRLCLTEEGRPLFKAQLRAYLRAGLRGKIRIMFPMISGVDELREAKRVLEEARRELNMEGIPYAENLPVGIMIEMPSAAMTADLLARECDFFSVGTNDLIQYSLAIDRENEQVSYLYTPLHPAILRLIKGVVDAAHARGIRVTMCGEMAGEPTLALLLLGLGLDELSMNPASLPVVKRVLREATFTEARQLTDEVMALATQDEIERHLLAKMRDRLPDQA